MQRENIVVYLPACMVEQNTLNACLCFLINLRSSPVKRIQVPEMTLKTEQNTEMSNLAAVVGYLF